MGSTSAGESASFEEAVRNMQALKAEHRTLLERIAGDQGMSPETRRMLVTHVLEEEDEHLARILSLAGGAAPAAPVTTRAAAPGLTVGSLRQESPVPTPSRGTIGSLRREDP